MSEGFAYIDIIFFAMVAAFIALRLRSVLGRRTGHERRRDLPVPSTEAQGEGDNVVTLPDRSGAKDDGDGGIADIEDDAVKAGLTQIRLNDRSFEVSGFIQGASAAFEMIIEAFAAGKKDVLRPLLSDDVYAGFAGAIDEREEKGWSHDTQLVGIKSAEIAEAAMSGHDAHVTVSFTSEQIKVTRDDEGKVIDGDPGRTVNVVDLWTFERDTRSSDPNWVLIATRSPN